MAVEDDVWVDQDGTEKYMIHQYKDYVGTETACTLTWIGKTTQDPSTQTVFLQIYNRDTTTWDTVDSNNISPTDENFTLTGVIADLTDYKDDNNVISCRVYQLAPTV